MNLCDRFPRLSPFDVRREKAREVFLLMRRMQNYNSYNAKEQSGGAKKKVIKRPAGDNWF